MIFKVTETVNWETKMVQTTVMAMEKDMSEHIKMQFGDKVDRFVSGFLEETDGIKRV